MKRRTDYSQQELEIFVTTWQSSCTVQEAVQGLLEHPKFRSTYQSRQGHTNVEAPLNISWCVGKANNLRYANRINLKRLPRYETCDYSKLAELADSMMIDNT